MRPGSLPLSQFIVLDLVAPPVAAIVWWLMARGWAGVVQGGKASEETRDRQRTEFWAVLIMSFIVLAGFTIYAWLG